MGRNTGLLTVLAAAGLLQCACDWGSGSSKAGSTDSSTVSKGTEKAAEKAPPAPANVMVPQGTPLQVRLNQAVSTDQNRAGDRFTAVLAAPVVVNEAEVIPQGASVSGRVGNSAASGRLKGRAVLSLAVDRIEWNGRTYEVVTAPVTRASADHKKRNWALIGGGSGAGALIGGLAGGGSGALIGAGAGAAAGTAGAALTGKRQVRIPAESLLTFRLSQPVSVPAPPMMSSAKSQKERS